MRVGLPIDCENELLKKYNISEDEFEVADIKWEELEYIYKDFSEKRSSYEQKLAEFQKEFLMNISEMVFILYEQE